MTTIRIDKSVMVPMRDGVRPATDVYRLDGALPAPVLLTRTSYDKEHAVAGSTTFDILRAMQAGYAVVIQDVRGRYASEGEFEPMMHETRDGVDMFAWAAAQPWSNGAVGSFGGSYLGATQWLPAREQPPALRAMAPSVTFSDMYEGCTYQGGASLDLDAVLAELPLASHPLIQEAAAFYRERLAHPTADAYWRPMSPNAGYDQITAPALNISGWYDIFLWSTRGYYDASIPRTVTCDNLNAADAKEEDRMNYTKLGNTGMDVSRICLGCMGFGDAERWIHKWVLNEESSRPIIKKALEMGINFFDTANVYSLGTSEEILGRALRDFANRDEVVIATKVHGKMREGPNGGGLSRKAILSEIDHSLQRLGTDYIDLYIIHRWDYQTPIEETMEALHDVVRAGKARYIGASAMWAWQFQKALYVAEKHGWIHFVSMQDHLNLIYREEEREMLPLCRAEGIGVTPYSPLASGRLTRDWSSERTLRSETDQIAKGKYDATAETDQQVVERVAELAEKHGVPRVHIALAWLLQKQPVTAPIIGATKISHLEDAVGALSVKLSQEEVAYLEEPYVPHSIVGHQ